MSSREIAELTGKRHGDVIRDIRVFLDAAITDWEKDDANLRHQGISITYDNRGYVSEFLLPKDITIALVAGYDANLRLKIVRRWIELEEAEARNLPTVTDALVAALAERLVPTLDQLVTARLASARIQQRRGETAGEIARRWNLPRLKSLAAWLGNRLEDAGVPVVGRGDLGTSKARTFDPDAADDAMKAGVNALALRYVNTKLGAANDNDLFSRLAI